MQKKPFLIVPFRFQDISIKEACWINSTPYFTRKAIGEWLGYSFPEKTIAKIIERNPHIKQFQVVVKLTTHWGKNQIKKDHKVCDPIGLQLIINKSSTPRAIQFQISAAKLVLAYMKGELIPKDTPETLLDDPREIAQIKFEEFNRLPHGKKGNAMKNLANEFGIAVNTLYGWLTEYKKTGKIEDKRKTVSIKKQIKTMHLARWKKIYNMLKSNYSNEEIKKELGVSDSQIRRVKTKYKPRWF